MTTIWLWLWWVYQKFVKVVSSLHPDIWTQSNSGEKLCQYFMLSKIFSRRVWHHQHMTPNPIFTFVHKLSFIIGNLILENCCRYNHVSAFKESWNFHSTTSRVWVDSVDWIYRLSWYWKVCSWFSFIPKCWKCWDGAEFFMLDRWDGK